MIGGRTMRACVAAVAACLVATAAADPSDNATIQVAPTRLAVGLSLYRDNGLPPDGVLAVPSTSSGDLYALFNTGDADPLSELVLNFKVVDLSWACYETLRAATGSNASVVSLLIPDPTIVVGVFRYYPGVNTSQPASAIAAQINAPVPADACNDPNSQIRLATSLRLAAALILTQYSSPLVPETTGGATATPTATLATSTSSPTPTTTDLGELSPTPGPATWPIDSSFLSDRGAQIAVWGLSGPSAGYLLGQLESMQQDYLHVFPNLTLVGAPRLHRRSHRLLRRDSVALLNNGTAGAGNTSALDPAALATRLVIRVGSTSTSSRGMWEFTLILVVVLLAVSFAASIAMHCHLYHMRRRNSMLQAHTLGLHLDDDLHVRRALTQAEADQLPTRLFCRAARHDQKRAFLAMRRKGGPSDSLAVIIADDSEDPQTVPCGSSSCGSAGDLASNAGAGTLEPAGTSEAAADPIAKTESNRTLAETPETVSTREKRARSSSMRSVCTRKTARSMAAASLLTVDSEDAATACTICLEEYVDNESILRELPCLHYFHVECIDEWLTTQRNECPLCKRRVRPCGCVDEVRDSESDDDNVVLADIVVRSPSAAPVDSEVPATDAPSPEAPPERRRPSRVRRECVHERAQRLEREAHLALVLEGPSASVAGPPLPDESATPPLSEESVPQPETAARPGWLARFRQRSPVTDATPPLSTEQSLPSPGPQMSQLPR